MPPQNPRICMLLEPFYPVHHGGAELQAWQLSHQLVAQGIKVIVVTRRIQPQLDPVEIVDSITIYRVPPAGQRTHWVNLVAILNYTWHLLTHRHEYDLLHVHDVRSLFIVALLVGSLTGKPFIVKVPTYGDVLRRPAKSKRLSLYSKILYRFILPKWVWFWFLRRAAAWVAISHEIADELTEAGLSHKTWRVTNAVEIDRFHSASSEAYQILRQKLNLPSDCPILISHGRIVQRKRLDVLIEAVAQLRVAYPNVIILLPGETGTLESQEKDRLEQMAQIHHMENNIRFLGPISNIEDYLRASDIFVMPSEREGLPNALIEAMACGLPVIASEIGGVVDLIVHQQNGLLFPVGNATALAKTVSIYLENPEFAQKMGNEALRTVQTRYTWDIVTRSYLKLYMQILFRM